MTPSNKKKLRLEQAHLSPERLKTAKIEECIRNLRRRRRYLDLSILFLHLHIPSLERRTQSNFTSVLSRNSPTQSPKAALPYLQGFPGVLHTTRPLHEGEKQATHHPLSINVRYRERCNKTLEELKGKEHELSLLSRLLSSFSNRPAPVLEPLHLRLTKTVLQMHASGAVTERYTKPLSDHKKPYSAAPSLLEGIVINPILDLGNICRIRQNGDIHIIPLTFINSTFS
jgi:hypothetical protein